MKPFITICWLRRDLRLHDNTALFYSLQSPFPVQVLFLLDKYILSELDVNDARLGFIYTELECIKSLLMQRGSDLMIRFGAPAEVWEKLIDEFNIHEVHVNHDYDPYAVKRDDAVAQILASKGISFYTWKDQVIFEKNEILNRAGNPYTVFTPYSRAWMQKLNEDSLTSYPSEQYLHRLVEGNPEIMPSLRQLGFSPKLISFSPPRVDDGLIRHYAENRNIPSLNATSHLGIHLRFGTISIRQLLIQVKSLSETFLKELIWREFFMQVLWHHPHVVYQSFKRQYDFISWRNREEEFARWKLGETGFPIVDAGMRELNETGFMHNRVRMIVASFLTKHLLIDWRWGEAYFAHRLLDFELSSNNGNWQWVAGSGCDATPYFRIFNPTEQEKKFDRDQQYVRKWVNELGTSAYPKPMVVHKTARLRSLHVYETIHNYHT